MKKIFTAAALMLAATWANAQTTATNWTAPDCNSISHNLFSELDSGYVIVFVWVMPCGSCVNGATAAYNAAQSFATSHPGKVRYYLADDLGDYSCTNLASWITSNSIGSLSNITIFSNAGNVIPESNFGGSGMPHVVVMAGGDHEILYNKKNSATNDQPGITAAISTGLNTLNTKNVAATPFIFTPNPAGDLLNIRYAQPITHFTLTAVNGQVVKNIDFEKGKLNPVINLVGVPAGVYYLRATDATGKIFTRQLSKQ